MPAIVAHSADQPPKQIDLVVAVHTLHDGRQALQAEAGVDSGLRQRGQFAVRLSVELGNTRFQNSM